MLFGRAALYFDEVARRGSLRRAAEVLHVAPSAVDRQIILLEAELGSPLFERNAKGMRMTAAGEVLVEGVRRWRRDLIRIRAQIDDLKGLRRGEISIALVEGATEFLTSALVSFQQTYPAIDFRMEVNGSQGVVDKVLTGEVDVAITFNPPDNPTLRIERTMIYRLGIVCRPDHELASRPSVSLQECSAYPLIIPDDSISLRRVLNLAWARMVGGNPRGIVEASSIDLIKSLSRRGIGIGFVTAIDAFEELHTGALTFVPLSDERIELSNLAIVSAAGRTLSRPAALLVQHLGKAMEGQDVPVI